MIKKFVFSSTKTLVISLFSLFFSYFLLRFQVKLVGIEERGVFILAQSSLAILTSLVKFGIGQSVVKLIIDHDKSEVSTNFIFLIFLQGIFILLVSYFLISNTSFFGNNAQGLSKVEFLFFAISNSIFNSLSNFSFLINNSYIFTVQTLAFGILNILILWTFTFFTSVDINVLLLSITFSQLLVTFYLFYNFPIFKFSEIKYSILKKLITEGGKSLGWSFIKDLSYKIDLFIFGNILSKFDFGIYSLLQNLCQTIWRLTDPIMSAYSKYLLSVKKELHSFLTDKILYILYFSAFSTLILTYFTFEPIFSYISGFDFNDYQLHISIFIFSVMIFNVWKLLANYFIQKGRHMPMYNSLISSLFLYFICSLFVKNLLNAIIATASISLIISTIILFFYIFSKNNKNQTNVFI